MKRHTRQCRAAGLWAAAVLLAPAAARAGASLGDAGHYLHGNTKLYVHNPDGRAFDVTVHRFPWWIGAGWNEPDLLLVVESPAGSEVLRETLHIDDDGTTAAVPAGPAGAYRLSVGKGSTLNYWYVTTSLEKAVAWTGDGEGDALRAPWFMANPFVARTWYFWVPRGTREFAVRTQGSSGRSQREDGALILYSPRGQRYDALFGNPNNTGTPVSPGRPRPEREMRVHVEPGSGGRFWALEIGQGDSHVYNDISVALEGVPPYLARSPEEWFHPGDPAQPDLGPYDDDEFVQSDRTPGRENNRWGNWSPCPALGDPDACELLCPTRAALWNPADRELKFVIGTYLPRHMFTPGPDGAVKPLAEDRLDHARVRLAGAGGASVLDVSAPLMHLHAGERWERKIRTGAGVATVDVADAEHFWMYTYPATPAVLVGADAGENGKRFRFEIGHARNWYFYVPAGTRRFGVRAAVEPETDTMVFEVNAPDRTMAMVYGREADLEVDVPAGLDGKIWHVRVNIGSRTVFDSRLSSPRFPSMRVTLDLEGVPGLLAPTWEQWFDPADPRPPLRRAAAAGTG